jgi:cytochrome d ubiquinol oxidase subunit II
LGDITAEPASFYEAFMAPWLNSFAWALGFFTCCLFSFLAAIYLIGETESEEVRKHFLRIARNANFITVVVGGLVFIAAEWNGLPLAAMFWQSTPALVAAVLATLSLPLLWWSLVRQRLILPRLLAGFQALMIMGAWFWVQYPVVMRYKSGEYLGLFENAAPEATMRQLGLALLVGSVLILPALFYLLKTFKANVGMAGKER